MSDLLYETHVPRYGYTKLWPSSWLCPICKKNSIMRIRSHKPLYVPPSPKDEGERVVIYICNTCYQILVPAKDLSTVESAEEYYKCHLELKTHLNTLRKEPI